MKVSELWKKLQRVHEGGTDDDIGGLPSWFQSGDGSPVGTVTPVQKGSVYQDTTNGGLYEAVGTTSDDWVSVGGSDGAAYLAKIGVMLPDPVGDALYIYGNASNDQGLSLNAAFSGRSGASLSLQAGLNIVADDTLLGHLAVWRINPTGSISMPKASAGNQIATNLFADVAAPNDTVGADGDWSLGADGHIYFKTGGTWTVKV